MPISNQLPGDADPWRGRADLRAAWEVRRDASGAIAADSVIVPAADGTGLDIEARDDGPASRSASCRTRSSGPGGRRPARRQPGPGPAADGRVRVPGSGPPISSRNGGYLSVISPA